MRSRILAAPLALVLLSGCAARGAAGDMEPQVEPEHGQHGDPEPAQPATPEHAQHGAVTDTMPQQQDQASAMDHDMFTRSLGADWELVGMAQAFPVVTVVAAPDDSQLDETELYLTQTVVMANVQSRDQRFALRVTPNFEGITLDDGELTLGAWGEGFIDKRHPHTLVHELMLSVNFWDVAGGALSLSAGKGFAPFGTDDPMTRPALKYPTNHHLSQILERWTLNAVYLNRGWSLEAAIFGGEEPEDPYDFSNIESFGDSWSARLAKRFGAVAGPFAAWELAASFGSVEEAHEEDGVASSERTILLNAALRHSAAHGFGDLYFLVEGSRSDPEDDDGFFSVLGEAALGIGPHAPYYRLEYATRPEFRREEPLGGDGFFRYDHDEAPIGATRWLINTLGYGYTLTGLPVSARPFVEVKHARIDEERGGIAPETLFGGDSLWSLSAGFRFFFGGDPMRMGAYGVLDPMTFMMRDMAMESADHMHQ